MRVLALVASLALVYFAVAVHADEVFHYSHQHRSLAATRDWSYNYEQTDGPDQWGVTANKKYSKCDGTAQSPVDFDNTAAEWDSTLTSLKPVYKSVTQAKVTNNGHAIQVDLPSGMSITGGNLKGTYTPLQFHFHTNGEHTVGGGAYPLEMHIVHINQDLGHQDIRNDPLSLAVVGFLIQQGPENDFLKPVVEAAKTLLYEGNFTYVDLPRFENIIPTANQFWTYSGSLTNPPCSETVTWHVLQKVMTASGEQIQALRRPYSYTMNYRPTQKVENRVIKTNVYPVAVSNSAYSASSSFMVILSILALCGSMFVHWF